MMKKLSLSLLAIAAVSALVMGGTLALFTASATNTGNTFTAGTVTLNATAHTALALTNIAPGDGDTDSYTVTYAGSLAAFVGVDVNASGALLNCDTVANSLQLNVDGHAITSDGDTVPDWTVPNGPGNLFHATDAHTFVLTWSLPSAAGNGCQGKSAAVDMTVTAVQSAHNTNGSNDGPISWN